jgi:hypothetical protein
MKIECLVTDYLDKERLHTKRQKEPGKNIGEAPG